MSEVAKFFAEVTENIERLGEQSQLHDLSADWLRLATEYKYAHNFTWLGRPIIQLPQDIVALQEIIWRIQPTLIVETGIAHGGSLIFHASILRLLDNGGHVVGVDVDIRSHNRREIENHPMFDMITLIEGSSVSDEVVRQVHEIAQGHERTLVLLDSNHTHEHVLSELNAYHDLVNAGSYLIVYDTAIEDLPEQYFPDRPWGPGNSPKSAAFEFLEGNDRFEIDKSIDHKLQLTVAPDGYLKCVKDSI